MIFVSRQAYNIQLSRNSLVRGPVVMHCLTWGRDSSYDAPAPSEKWSPIINTTGTKERSRPTLTCRQIAIWSHDWFGLHLLSHASRPIRQISLIIGGAGVREDSTCLLKDIPGCTPTEICQKCQSPVPHLKRQSATEEPHDPPGKLRHN